MLCRRVLLGSKKPVKSAHPLLVLPTLLGCSPTGEAPFTGWTRGWLLKGILWSSSSCRRCSEALVWDGGCVWRQCHYLLVKWTGILTHSQAQVCMA